MTGPGSRGTVVVTGASSGIGGEFARQLAGRGHAVVLVARRRDRLKKLAAELAETGAAVEVLVADLTRSYDVGRVAERAARSDVTVLVNSAGINGYRSFFDVEPSVISDVIALNVTALTLLCRAAIAGMAARGTGAIINVSSLLAFSGGLAPDPLPARATYVGTKAYVVALTRTLAAEPEAKEIYLQVLCPGRSATEFHDQQGSAPVSDAGGPADPGEMSAADVVRASLAGMDSTEILVVPGLEDLAALDRLAKAEGLLSAGNKPTLARRYST